jgi:hypothetical protein
MKSEGDAASLIRESFHKNPVLIARFISMISRDKNVAALVLATYWRCRDRYRNNPSLTCRNPMRVILNMAESVVRGNMQAPRTVPEKFAEHFTVGRNAVELAEWRQVEMLVHSHVTESLWGTASLLFNSGEPYDFRSVECRALTRQWASWLNKSIRDVKRDINQVRQEIKRGRFRANPR